MEDNVCKFLSTRKPDERINIINFVYERECSFSQENFLITSTYSMALVTEGRGTLHTTSEHFPLSKGTLFFTFSAKPFRVSSEGDLKYIYISFTGLRALSLLQRLHIDYTHPLFPGFDSLITLWEQTLFASEERNADLFCEGLLLYTLGFICNNNDESEHSSKSNNILLAKQYVDMHYTDADLNLKSVSQRFNYNPKYFSSAFKKLVMASFCDYLKNRRLSYAASLIQSGITNIKDLAELSGYNDPMYFSKCFKEQYGVSPKNYTQKTPPDDCT